MTCDQADNLISARIDGQLSRADTDALDSHLAGCTACRATATAFSSLDADLDRAFTPRRQRATAVAESAIRQIRWEQRRPTLRMPWLNTLLAAAAGFAIAFLILQPWTQRSQTTHVASDPKSIINPISSGVPQSSVGQLSLATGLIELLPPGASDWQPLATGASIQPGHRVRTGDGVRCEFLMADGSTLRLNTGSDLLFTNSRAFDLKNGQMWSMVARNPAPFTVAAADATVTALGTEFDVRVDSSRAILTVLEGATKITSKAGETIVPVGHRCEIISGSPMPPKRVGDLLTATTWVNELLLLKGRDNAELNQRVNDMLAQIGNTKMSQLYDEEIRSLGDHCVMPLTRYLQSNRDRGQSNNEAAERRHRAARILSDMAQPWSIPDLITLLLDEDSTVQYSAARGLRRLVGSDLGYTPEGWRNQPQRVKEAHRDWQKWWAENKQRYPRPPILSSPSPSPSTKPDPAREQTLQKAKA